VLDEEEDPDVMTVNLMQFAGKFNSKRCLYDTLRYDGKYDCDHRCLILIVFASILMSMYRPDLSSTY